MPAEAAASEKGGNRKYARGLARAFGGAVLFAFPLLMTMEMWWIGFYIDRLRLFVFLVLGLALLVPLSRLVGFESTARWRDDVIDALVAFAIGAVASALLLAVFGIIDPAMPANEIAGKIAIQTVPASLGAVLARDQMASNGGKSDADGKDGPQARAGYAGQLLIMVAGALFLAFNVAPTEEMILIAFKMTYVHAIALVLLSIVILHAFVFALDFSGQESLPNDSSRWSGLVNHSLAGYGIAVLISLYVLWTFGRTVDVSLQELVMMVIVLAFPSALGAASARLVI